ncbi:MAG: hypothetical protein RL088_482 [Verrucomicrobiota bacterium]|jgi:hypothetical protein
MIHTTIEALENRIAPAVLGVASIFVDASDLTVSLSAGTLKIAPKTAGVTSLDVTVELLPDGSLLISDSIGDSDLEDIANLTGNVRNIQATLTAGDDRVKFLLDSDYTVAGNISVTTGAGTDEVELIDGAIRGNLTILGKGDNNVQISGGTVRGLLSNTSVGGTFKLAHGASVGALTASGATDFIVEGLVKGNATLSAKTGNASFQVGGVANPAAAIGGNLTINAMDGADDIYLGNVLVRGAFAANLGGGDNDTFISADTSILGVARITGRTGIDNVTLGTVGSVGPGIYGRLSLTLGDGANSFLGHSGLISGGLTYTGGAGVDTVDLGAGLTLFGDANIAVKNGANVVSVGSFSSLWKFTLAGGIDNDTVTLATVGAGYVNGSVNLGAGNDALTLSGVGDFFSTFKVDGGTGADTSTVSQTVLDNGLVQTGIETITII